MKNSEKQNHIHIGKQGEELAASFLVSQGYEILEKNWRFKKAEIDIICRKDQILIFVEVKAKSYTFFGAPEESISQYKENLIVDAATQYMVSIRHEWEIRFDIISVVFIKNQAPQVFHFEDAFFPGL